MTFSQVVLIIFTVMALSVGQVLFKISSSQINFSLTGILPSLLNIQLILALFVYFFATGMWLFVLKQLPLRVAYPYVALAFVIVPLLSHFLLNEKLQWNTFVGAALIFSGVWVTSLK
ncbi:EamA family transporter [Thiothrix lacustris]|uniref:EamA family transporter n=1 Tax=Thiothrix lacustris TaxID=525917 RepID=A0ABY9MR28_9GAMM|nr:EamA family transporter [Thiothrix lacustris]WML89825.1 EamA family transporter [Thiothrix lacustris]WMP18576.1 EamA family transporter [Thiothrix lacustris]